MPAARGWVWRAAKPGEHPARVCALNRGSGSASPPLHSQHLPPPKGGPQAQLALGFTQRHSALEAVSWQQRFSHTRTHIPAHPGANQLFSPPPFPCGHGETEAREG